MGSHPPFADFPSDRSDKSDRSDSSESPRNSALRPHGGYRKLRSFQVAQLIYDCTKVFCDRFIERGSRTRDQMVQAARSGVQNIAEGSAASGTSKKTELKLTGVARASLEELLLDYEDFLRQRRLVRWQKDSSSAMAIRGHGGPPTVDGYAIAHATAETSANTVICLIHQASYLLRRQLAALDQQFMQEGGFTERLYRTRKEQRGQAKSEDSDQSDRSDWSDQSDSSEKVRAPSCPNCRRRMVRRTAQKGRHAGQPFWGCSDYPKCTGITAI